MAKSMVRLMAMVMKEQSVLHISRVCMKWSLVFPSGSFEKLSSTRDSMHMEKPCRGVCSSTQHKEISAHTHIYKNKKKQSSPHNSNKTH